MSSRAVPAAIAGEVQFERVTGKPSQPARRFPVVCPRCGKSRTVKHPKRQNKSWRCRPCAHTPSKNLTPEARARGAAKLLVANRQRFKARLAALAGELPIEIARRYYRIGWKAGARSVRKRLEAA